MADEQVIFKFLDKGTIHAIPARDLTQRDFDRLSLDKQRDVRAGTLYEAVGDVSEAPRDSAPDFEAMTKEQLAEYAEQHDIAGVDPGAKKADMIAAIQAGGEG